MVSTDGAAFASSASESVTSDYYVPTLGRMQYVLLCHLVHTYKVLYA
jgi:hypothetical protein